MSNLAFDLSNLNEKEQMVLDFVRYCVKNKGYPPSVREICSAVGFKSTSTAHRYLGYLDSKGYIHKEGAKTRAIGIVGEIHSEDITYVPYINPKNDATKYHIPLSTRILSSDDDGFAFRMIGSYMNEAGIEDEDIILVSRNQDLSSGDIGVMLIEENLELRYFYRENSSITLKSCDKSIPDMYIEDIKNINNSGIKILGKIIGVYRMY